MQATPQGALFDFQDADLRLVLSALAEVGGLNLIYSDLPDRRVTLRMRQPVARENIMPLLKSLAASNNLRVIEEAGLVRIEYTGPREAGPAAAQADTGAVEPELRLFVYRLKHARATRLAGTLQAIFGGGSGPPAAGISRPPLSQRLREYLVPPMQPDQPPEVRADVGRVQAPSLPGRLLGDAQIVPDEATNSLLIRAQPDDWDVIRQAVESLDLRPLQVLIEVVIAEVRRTTDFALGVSGQVGSDSGITGSQAIAELSSTGQFALRVMGLGDVPFSAALTALASRGEVRILSRPVLLAQNNQEARILIGSERPFVQVFRSLPTDNAVRDQIIQYRDVGTSLAIVPTINEDGYVNLQVSQEVSTATAETQFGAPVISTREASTHLFVKDGQTVVIGGLVDRQRDRTRSGIPLLKDLPLVGGFFGSTRDATIASELFLFVTPHVIATDEEAERIRQGVERGADDVRRELERAPVLIPPARPDSVRPKP